MKKIKLFLLACIALLVTSVSALFAQEKVGPTPTKEQLAWHEKEFYLYKSLILDLQLEKLKIMNNLIQNNSKISY